MVKRIGGFRRKTRHKLQKPLRARGKLSISKFFQKFKQGDQVQLVGEPSYQKGTYFPRFHGKVGIVMGKQGHCYNVLIKDQRKDKMLVVHPVHLKKTK